jgi:DNA-binding CsgD family transcriptional regulator/PAS domain-containing protein
MIEHERLTRICDDLYEAAAVPDHWPQALAGLSSTIGAASAHLVRWNRSLEMADFAVTGRGDVKLARQYSYEYGRIDPTRRALERSPCGSWVANHTLFDKHSFLRHPYNAEFLLPSGYQYVLKSRVVDHADGSYSVFGLVRTANSEPFSNELLDGLRASLGPHLRRAAMLSNKLAPARVRGRISEAALDHLPVPVVIVAETARVLLVNQAAVRALDASKDIAVRRSTLRVEDPTSDQKLRSLLRLESAGGVIRVPRPDAGPLVVSVTPLTPDVDLPCAKGDRSFLVSITDPMMQMNSCSTSVLRQVYGLTPAEAQVATLLGEGLSLAEAAERQGIAVATARVELKRVFAKIGVSRQGELVAVLARLNQVIPERGK